MSKLINSSSDFSKSHLINNLVEKLTKCHNYSSFRQKKDKIQYKLTYFFGLNLLWPQLFSKLEMEKYIYKIYDEKKLCNQIFGYMKTELTDCCN